MNRIARYFYFSLIGLVLLIPSAGAIPGDLDYSGRVDGEDLINLARQISPPDQPEDDLDYDLDRSGRVDVRDAFVLQRNFGLRGQAPVMWVADNSAKELIKVTPSSGRKLATVTGFPSIGKVVADRSNQAWVALPAQGRVLAIAGNLQGDYDIESGTGSHRYYQGFGTTFFFDVDTVRGNLWVLSGNNLFRISSNAPDGYNVLTDSGFHATLTSTTMSDIVFDSAREIAWVPRRTTGQVIRLQGNFPDGYNLQSDTGFHQTISVSTPTNVAVDPTTGICWVVRSNAHIHQIPAAGGQAIAGLTNLTGIVTIAVDPFSGSCWYVRSNGEVGKILPAGNRTEITVSGFTSPTLIAPRKDTAEAWLVNNRNELVLLSRRGDIVVRRTTTGDFVGLDMAGMPLDTRTPKVDLLVSNDGPELGRAVNFTAFVTQNSEPIVSYAWDFEGDGVINQITANPTTIHVYNQPAVNYPTVIAIDNRGFEGYSAPRRLVSGQLQAFVVANPTSGSAPMLVQFQGSYYDPLGLGTVLNYRYDFDGDGVDDYTSQTQPNASYTYNIGGVYDAAFKVTFQGGIVSMATVRIQTDQVPPVAVAEVSPLEGLSPMTVLLVSNKSTDRDGQILLYQWDVDDNGIADYVSVTPQSFPHTYTQAGDYLVTLKVTDNAGLTDSDSVLVRVGESPPTAIAQAVPTLGNAPLSVQLIGDQSVSPESSLVYYEWYFKDGDYLLNDQGFPQNQLFLGPFPSLGCDDVFSMIGNVPELSPSADDTLGGRTWVERNEPTGQFQWRPIFTTANNQYGFSHIYLYSQDAREVHVRYRSQDGIRFWLNGDLVHSSTQCFSVLPTVEHVVNLTLDSGWNRFLAACSRGTGGWQLGYRFTDIYGRPLVASYRTSLPAGNLPAGYYGSSSQPNTTHIYQNPGIYTPRLVVTDDRGIQASDEVRIEVLDANAVIAAARAVPNTGEVPLAVQLIGSDTTDPNNNIILYEWDYYGGIFQDDVEGDLKWVADYPWARTTVNPRSGKYAWTDSPLGNYLPNTDTSLRSFPVDLKSATSPVLRFWHRYQFGSGDRGTVEVSTDGALTWQEVARYTGTLTNYAQANVNLSAFEGQEMVIVRFRVFADGNTSVGDGWTIDDIVIESSSDPYTYQSATVADTNYTYPIPGWFEPTIRVSDADGFVSTASARVRVLSPPRGEIIMPAAGSVYSSLTVDFTARVWDLDGFPVLMEWDYEGNGTYDVALTDMVPTQYTFATEGNKTSRLRITDDSGLQTVLETHFSISKEPLTVQVSATPTSGNVNLNVTFQAVSRPLDRPIVSYRWDLDGDGVDDIVSEGLPGRVLDVPSVQSAAWAANNLINGGTDTNQGWATTIRPTYPVDLTFELHGGRTWMIDRFVIAPHTQGRNRNDLPASCQLLVSEDNLAIGFVPVLSFTLDREDDLREFSFAPVSARYVRLRVFSNQGGDYVSIGDVRVESGGQNILTSLAAQVSRTYTVPGDYPVRVTVRDAADNTASDIIVISALSSTRMVPTLQTVPTRPIAGQDVFIFGDSTAPGSTVAKYEYDFNNDGAYEFVDDNRGFLVSFSSQENTSSRKAENLIDGRHTSGFRWASALLAAATVPQEFVFRFADFASPTIDTMIISPVSDHGVDSQANLVELQISNVSETAGFTSVGFFNVEKISDEQIFRFTPFAAQWVKFIIHSSHGTNRYGMSELRLLEVGTGVNRLALDGDTIRTFAHPGSYPITLRATDATGRSATASIVLEVDAPFQRDEIRLWLANQDASIFRTDVEGNIDKDIRGFGRTVAIAHDPTRGMVWVSDDSRRQVYVIDENVPATGYNVTSATEYHRSLSGFTLPSQAVIDPNDGTTWLVDTTRATLYIIDPLVPHGYDVSSGTEYHRTVIGFRAPARVAWDTDFDAIWVTDRTENAVFKIDRTVPNGYDVRTDTSHHRKLIGFNQPFSIVVDRQRDRIWISNYNANEVYQLIGTPPDGYHVGTDTGYHKIALNILRPRGLSLDPLLGNVLVCSETGNSIVWLDENMSRVKEIPGLTNPFYSIFNDRTGEIYLFLGSGRRYHRLSLNGTNLTMQSNRPSTVMAALVQPPHNPASDPQVMVAANPAVGAAPLPVNFTVTASSPGSSIARYNWDFEGDGTFNAFSESIGNTSHNYSREGFYFPMVEVVDQQGRIARSWSLIRSGRLRATLVATPSAGRSPLNTVLSLDAFSPYGISSIQWDLNDDGIFEVMGIETSRNETVRTVGRRNFRARVVDTLGSIVDAQTEVVTVGARPVITTINANPRTGERPLSVNFTASASDADGTIVSYAWDFTGDGVVNLLKTDNASANYVYTSVGPATATLTVTDNDGQSGTASIIIDVKARSPRVTPLASPVKANVGDTVSFDAIVVPDAPIAEYGWDFDGNKLTDHVSAVSPQSTFVYQSPGLYGAVLGVTDEYNTVVNSTVFVEVRPAGTPFAIAEAIPDEISLGQTIELRSDQSYDPNGSLVEYRWILDPTVAWVGNSNTNQLLGTRIDGSRQAASETISQPFGLATHPTSGDVWATSAGQARILRYDRKGIRLATILGFNSPRGITLDAGRNVGWVADYNNSRVVRYNLDIPDGYNLSNRDDYHVVLTGLSRPYDVAVDLRNGACWVLEDTARIIRRIAPNGTETQVQIAGWAGTGSLAVDPDSGVLWVTNRSAGQLYRILPTVPDGYNLGVDTAHHTVLSGLQNPNRLGIVPGSGEVWVVAEGSREVILVNAAATQIMKRIGGFTNPSAIVVLPDTKGICVTDTSTNTVVGYTAGGERRLFLSTGYNNPRAITYALRDRIITTTTPEVQFFTPDQIGEYPIELVVTDNEGIQDNDLALVTVIMGLKPVALPRAHPVEGYAPLTVRFVADGYDPDGTMRWFRWDYNGDGTINASQQTNFISEYTYTIPGVYDAVLTVEDSALGGAANDPVGNTDSKSIRITVLPPETLSVEAIAQPEEGRDPLVVVFHARFSGVTAPLASFEWDFNGDGVVDYSSTQTPVTSHIYTQPGVYLAQLKVTDTQGRTASDLVLVRVRDRRFPTASASATPTSGQAPLVVQFTGQGSDFDGTVVKYEWDFDGDGIFDYSSEVTGITSHIYDRPGVYHAQFRVTDNDGFIGATTVMIEVSAGLTASWNVEAFDPLLGQESIVSTSLVSGTTVTVRIMDSIGQLVRNLVDGVYREPGVYLDRWNGRSQTGQVVPPGSYFFVVDYYRGGELVSYDLTNTTGTNYQTPSVTYPATFNPLENRFLFAQFNLTRPAEITSYIPPWTGRANFPVRTIYMREPFKSGTVVIVWDGTDDKGIVVPPGDYLQAVLAWPLPLNGIIVASRPVVSDWRVEPVYFVPGVNPYKSAGTAPQQTEILFSLSKLADVEALFYDNENQYITRVTRPGLSAGRHSIFWDGRREGGGFVPPGLYHARIVATTTTGLESHPVNAIIKVVY